MNSLINNSVARRIIVAFLIACFAHSPGFAQHIDRESLEEEFLFFSDEELASIGSLHKEPISISPGIITVITSRTIEKMAARNLLDVLKTVPGFDTRYSNFGENFLSIRGDDNPAHILFMLDGHRFNDFYSGAALYDIHVDGIDRIEIIRGPGSAIYGTNAMVGAINVIMKKEEGLKIKVGAGTFDTYKGSLQFGQEQSAWKAFGFVEYSQTAGPNGTVPYDRLTNQAPAYSTAPNKIKDNKTKTQGSLSLVYKQVETTLNYYDESRGPNVAYLDVMSDKSKIASNYLSIDVKRKFDISGSTQVMPRVYADRWKWDYRIQLYPNGYVDNRDLDGDGNVESFPDGEWLLKTYESVTVGTEWIFVSEAANSHRLTYGASLEESDLSNTKVETNYEGEPDVGAIPRTYFANWNNYGLPGRSRIVYAGFLQEQWTIDDRASIVMGARYDHYSDFGDTTNPRIAVSIFPMKKVDVKLQYAMAFRAPTFKELYDETDLNFFGNQDLQPETIETMEIGIGYTYGKNSFVRMNVFKNTISDVITTLLNAARTGATKYENSGKIETIGWELEARHSFEDDSYVYGNTGIFNIKDSASDTWLTRIPQLRVNAGVNKRLFTKAWLNVFWLYSEAKASNTRTNEERIRYNRATAGPYHMINAAFTRNDLFSNINLKISVFNLLNTDYREMYSGIRYRLPDINFSYSGGNLIPSNQRIFLVELQKEF